MKALAFIFARGGSKGVPGKNIRLLAGKPLIAYAIEAALGSRHVDRVIISTDDQQIADIARAHGGDVPFLRPAELADDRSPEWLAWRHALTFVRERMGLDPDIFVSIPTTSPLRVSADVDACIDRYAKDDADAVLTVTPAQRNPYFNMVTLDGSGFARLAAQSDSFVSNRQQAPAMYDITTLCYAVRPDFIMSATGLFDGRVGTVIIPQERALDIDTEFDFRIAEALLNE